jgi:hypothetical protein
MSDKLETVATFGRPEEAGMARGVLASCGIRSFVCEEMAQGMMWHLRPILGGVRLQVAAEDLDKARAVLRELEQPQPPQSFTPEDDEDDKGEGGDRRGARAARRRDLLDPEACARRAWQAAVQGLVFLPVLSHIHSLRLAVFALSGWGDIDAGARRRLLVAVALDLGVICLAAGLLWRWVSPDGG